MAIKKKIALVPCWEKCARDIIEHSYSNDGYANIDRICIFSKESMEMLTMSDHDKFMHLTLEDRCTIKQISEEYNKDVTLSNQCFKLCEEWYELNMTDPCHLLHSLASGNFLTCQATASVVIVAFTKKSGELNCSCEAVNIMATYLKSVEQETLPTSSSL